MPVPTQKASIGTQRVLLQDLVMEKLREAITDGVFVPGETLNDQELQQWLGVSRTPISYALKELARIGLVEMQPGRFTRVATPNREEVVDAMRAYGVLVGGVARFAVPNLTQATRAKALSDIARIQMALEASDLIMAKRAVADLWGGLVEITGNAALQRIYRDSVDGLFFTVRPEYFLELFTQEGMGLASQRLAQAIADGDAVAAERVTEQIYQFPDAPPA